MLGRKWSLTLKQRADFPPAGDASFTGELTQGRLQEKHRDTAAHKEDDVWNKERTFKCTKNQQHLFNTAQEFKMKSETDSKFTW